MRNKGFTLIEMLVVTAISTVVLGIVVGAIWTTVKASTVATNAQILNEFSNSMNGKLGILKNATIIQNPNTNVLMAVIPKPSNSEAIFPLVNETQSQRIVWDVFWIGDRFERFMKSDSPMEQNHPMLKQRYYKNSYGNTQFEKTLYHAKILGALTTSDPPAFDPSKVFDPSNPNKPDFASVNGMPSYEEDLIPLDIFPNGERPADVNTRQAEIDAGLVWYVSNGTFGFNLQKQSIEFVIDVSAYNSIGKDIVNKHRVDVTIRTPNVRREL